jgi:hypothetical protein
MDIENKRRHERVETIVKAKLPGDSAWVECLACNISGGGLFFSAVQQPNIGDVVNLQFMLQSKSGTHTNIHFFASARVVRVTSNADIYRIAVEFIVDEDMRKEILRHIAMIKSQSLKVDRPTTSDAIFGKIKPE